MSYWLSEMSQPKDECDGAFAVCLQSGAWLLVSRFRVEMGPLLQGAIAIAWAAAGEPLVVTVPCRNRAHATRGGSVPKLEASLSLSPNP